MAKQTKQQADKGGSAFERAGSGSPNTDSDHLATSPAAAAVSASAPPVPPDCVPRGAVKCNACSTDSITVWCTPVAPGWNQCPRCKIKQRNLGSLKAAMRSRGGKSRAAR